MLRAIVCAGFALALLVACSPPPPPEFGTDGKPLSRIYRIAPRDKAAIQFRMLDAVNVLRQAGGLRAVKLNAELGAAAATHARDMSVQNRPWHFGSDGSSPIDRIARAGYRGELIGETISETFETELETLSAWMAQADTRGVILDARAGDMGFAWFQEDTGKIWWAMVLGTPEIGTGA